MKLGTRKVRNQKNSRTMESTYHYDGLTPHAYKFTGKERDTESGLDNFGARYDASTMGRFMTPDPLPWVDWQHGSDRAQRRFQAYINNPQNFNMYAYVRNNPTNLTDPTGMYVCKGTKDQCAAIQAGLAGCGKTRVGVGEEDFYTASP